MKTIEIRINPNGSNVEVDAQGFKGRQCTDFMENIMKALGGTIDEKRKPEYLQTVANGTQMRT